MNRLKKIAKISYEEERKLMLARQVDEIRFQIEQLAIRADRLSSDLDKDDAEGFSREVVSKLYDIAYNGYSFNKLSDKMRDEVVENADLI